MTRELHGTASIAPLQRGSATDLRVLLAALAVCVAGCTLSESSASFFQPRADDLPPDASVSSDSVPAVATSPIFSGPVSCDPTSCDDGLSCTNEACVDGQCKNLLDPGYCLIDGRCVRGGERVFSTGADLMSSCQICAPRVSQFVTTFASGMSCDDGLEDTMADVCMAGVCKGFHRRSWMPTPRHTSASLHAVAYVPRSSAVWAVGRQQRSRGIHPGGVIVRLDGAKAPKAQQLVARPLMALHDNLAVGLAAQALLYSPVEKRWGIAESLSRQLEGAAIRSVWTAQKGSTSRYYLAAARSGGTLFKCRRDVGASLRCQRESGLRGVLVRVAGINNSGAAPMLWALRGDGVQDIFHWQLPASAWSAQAPRGCADVAGASKNACVDSLGPFGDLWIGSSDEVWAVGHQGLVLRYDGLRWQRLQIGLPGTPTNYTFRGVWGAGQLTVLVGERQTAEDHELVALFYNAQLDRWYGPRILFSRPNTPSQRKGSMLLDINGRDASTVYMVGSSVDEEGRQRALIFSRAP